MLLKKTFFFCFSILFFQLNAQEDKKGIQLKEYEFKEVSREELRAEYYPEDSIAPAAILYEKGDLNFRYSEGWQYELEVKRRIKIYNKDGYHHANIEIPYYYPSTNKFREKIINVKARTYNLRNGKVRDERVRNRDIIDVEFSQKWHKLKFTFPKVEPGSVIEYKYTLVSPHLSRLNEWSFQHEIPTAQSVYKLSIPESFGYSERAKGYHKIHKTEGSHRSQMKMSYEGRGLRTEHGYTEMLFKDYTYTAVNVAKIKDEPFVNNQNNFMTSIDHELAFVKNMQTNEVEYFTKTWEDVAHKFYENEDFGGELKENNYYEEDIDKLLAEHTDDQAKLNAIFNYVKNKVKWNKNKRLYCSNRLKRIYDNGIGNSADINLMLTSMLRYAGFQAQPVLVSTISNGVPNTYPSRTYYNYVISGVELEKDQTLLLDATTTYAKPGQLPYRCLNWYGRLIRENGTTKQISLNPKKASKINYNLNFNVHLDGSITGKVRKQFTEQIAHFYRDKFTDVNEEEYIREIENDHDIEISDFQKKNVDKIGRSVIESFSFKKQNAIDIINDKIYLNPLTFLATSENPFKQNRKERLFPINFTYPRAQLIRVNINIPDGYKIEYMPEKKALALPKKTGLFSYQISKAPSGNLQIIVRQKINRPIFAAEFYQILKQFFTQVVEKETDNVVLTKL